MIILRPSWISHTDDKKKNATIFSLHLHPNGKKLATGSLDAKIKIWNTRPLFNPDDEMDESVPKLLSTLINHQGTVLCIRWSNGEGNFLASGSDDKIIIIWEYNNSSTYSSFGFGNDGVANIENYTAVRRLTGHESDVVDLAWSLDNSLLASCGLDSKIYIWDGSTFERLQCLSEHQGFVKGITWDPVGKYLASQSDDRTVKIWRTSDWKVEAEIKEPFKNTPSTTFFRRLSWSPDGGYIVTANAMNENHYIAAVIHRDEWKTTHSFIGHIAPVEVALFNPIIFQKVINTGEEETEATLSICAVGSQDRGISIWRTETSRAIIVANDVFDHSVLDMTWSNDGLSLLASSYDGTIVILQFTEEEFGKPLPPEKVNNILDKYGYSRQKVLAIEGTNQLDIEENMIKMEKNQASKRIAEIMGESTDHLTNNTLKTLSSPIKPTLENSNTMAVATAAAAAVATTTITSAAATNNHDNENNTTTEPTTKKTTNDTSLESEKKTSPTLNVQNILNQPIIQKVTQTKDGKKRIQPMFISGLSSSTNLMSNEFKSSENYNIGKSNIEEKPLISGSSSIIPSSGIPTLKRKPTTTDNDLTNVKKIFTSTENQEQSFILPTISPIPNIPTILAIPKIPKHIYFKIPHDENLLSSKILECDNSKEPVFLSCHEKDEIIWHDHIHSHVIHIGSSEQFSVIACRDGSLIIYSPSGRRLLPTLVLPAPATHLDTSGPYLMTINANGFMDVWNVIKEEVVLSSVSIGPLLKYRSIAKSGKSDITIINASIRSEGTPIITTSNGKKYSYHIKMKSWIYLTDKKSQGNAITNKLRTSLSQLEDELACLVATNSPKDFRRVLGIYARRLGDELAIERIKEFCDSLLGPVYNNNDKDIELFDEKKNKWNPNIMDMPKHELLEEMLLILGRNRALQRLISQYKDQLEIFKKKEKTE